MIKKLKTLGMITFLALCCGFIQTASAIELCCKDEACFLRKWTVFNTGFCTGLVQLDKQVATGKLVEGCTDFCNELKADFNVTPASTKKCWAALQAKKDDSKIKAVVNNVFKLVCSTLCTGSKLSCQSCVKSPKVAHLCGTICCNTGMSNML
jgi:hypothetical protein